MSLGCRLRRSLLVVQPVTPTIVRDETIGPARDRHGGNDCQIRSLCRVAFDVVNIGHFCRRDTSKSFGFPSSYGYLPIKKCRTQTGTKLECFL